MNNGKEKRAFGTYHWSSFEDYQTKDTKSTIVITHTSRHILTACGNILQVEISAICLTVCTVRLHAKLHATSCLVCIVCILGEENDSGADSGQNDPG